MLTSTEAVAASAVDSGWISLLLLPLPLPPLLFSSPATAAAPSPEKLTLEAPNRAAATADAAADCSAVLAASAVELAFALRLSPAILEDTSALRRLSSLEQVSRRSERLFLVVVEFL